jgi:hypothetical protein
MDSNKPNLYQLAGDHLHVSYTTTGIDGQPHLTYQDATQTLSFRGEDIRTVSTEIGTLVSVSIRRTVDTGSTAFSLLLPGVALDATNSAAVTTQGIITIHRFSPVPAFNHGQKELYTSVALRGTARFVVF